MKSKYLIATWLIVSSVLFMFAITGRALEYNQLIPEKSQITFISKQMGVAVTGEFKKFSADIVLDPKNLAHAQAKVHVDIASINTGSTSANQEVLGKNWFDATHFPTAQLDTISIKAIASNKYVATTKITIKGKTIDFSIPVTLTENGGIATVDGSFTLRRRDFSLGEGSWADLDTVANEVQVKFRLQLAAKK